MNKCISKKYTISDLKDNVVKCSNVENAKLFIIGNGFDLFFDLPTSTKHFENQLKQIRFEYFESAKEAYLYYGVDWSSFEEGLASINLEIISEEIVEGPDYMSDHEYDRDGVIWTVQDYTAKLLKVRKEALKNMVQMAEKEIETLSTIFCPDFFDSTVDEIISFNYTSTIESLFNYSKPVFHIHGYYKENDDDLLLGFGNESEDFYRFKAKLNSEMSLRKKIEINDIEQNKNLTTEEKEEKIRDVEYYDEEDGGNDYYIDTQYELLVDFYIKNKKEKQTNKLEDYLKKLKHIDEVVVLGHGMGDIDREYFELVEENIMPMKWTISARNEDGIKSVEEWCKTYSFGDKIHVKTMGEILGVDKKSFDENENIVQYKSRFVCLKSFNDSSYELLKYS